MIHCTLVTDEDGDIIKEMTGETTPFGEQENKNIFFTGKQWDVRQASSHNPTDTGSAYTFCVCYAYEDAQLYYFNARWYDLNTGRFITEDPMKDGRLWFGYVGNNSMGFVDFTGLKGSKTKNVGTHSDVPTGWKETGEHEYTGFGDIFEIQLYDPNWESITDTTNHVTNDTSELNTTKDGKDKYSENATNEETQHDPVGMTGGGGDSSERDSKIARISMTEEFIKLRNLESDRYSFEHWTVTGYEVYKNLSLVFLEELNLYAIYGFPHVTFSNNQGEIFDAFFDMRVTDLIGISIGAEADLFGIAAEAWLRIPSNYNSEEKQAYVKGTYLEYFNGVSGSALISIEHFISHGEVGYDAWSGYMGGIPLSIMGLPASISGTKTFYADSKSQTDIGGVYRLFNTLIWKQYGQFKDYDL